MKPKITSLQLICALFLAVAAIACGGGPRDTPAEEPHYLVGSLQDNVSQILRHEYAEDCDRSSGAQMQELAKALDDRQAEIDETTRNQPPTLHYKKVTLGPTYARELLAPLPAVLGWKEYETSWVELHDYFQTIKNSPVDSKWVWLNSSVRSILMDDDKRIGGANVYLDKDSGPKLALLQQAIAACIADPACTRPGWSSELQNFVVLNEFYYWYWSRLSRSDGRTILERFSRRVENDQKRYKFRSNSTVIRTQSGEITLPLSLGVFSDVAPQIIGYIEALWSSAGLKINIQSTTADLVPNLYQVLLGETTDTRAYVNWDERILKLFPNVRTRSIAHEVGHVLGFRDTYYTVWKPAQCKYIIQYREDDLMSSSDSGSVLPEDWQTLDRQYPVTH